MINLIEDISRSWLCKKEKELTINLSDKELVCKCGCGQLPSLVIAYLLELARHLGGNNPIWCSSGMRCRKHNEDTPGSSKVSLHMFGLAVDIKEAFGFKADNPSGRKAIMKILRSVGFYCIEENSWIHADLRLLFPKILAIRQLKY